MKTQTRYENFLNKLCFDDMIIDIKTIQILKKLEEENTTMIENISGFFK